MPCQIETTRLGKCACCKLERSGDGKGQSAPGGNLAQAVDVDRPGDTPRGLRHVDEVLQAVLSP